MTADITFPWAVMVCDNQRHGLMRGRILLTAKYRKAKESASLLAAAQWKQPMLKGRVALDVTLYEPDRRRRDILNYAKLLMDSLSMRVYLDDSQIDIVTMTRGPVDKHNARAVIEVTPL